MFEPDYSTHVTNIIIQQLEKMIEQQLLQQTQQNQQPTTAQNYGYRHSISTMDHQCVNPSQRPANSSDRGGVKHSTSHIKLFAFLKVMLKLMNRNGDSYLANQAKAVLSECITRNRRGDSDYMPLHQSIVTRLRFLSGVDVYWTLTRACLEAIAPFPSSSRSSDSTYINERFLSEA